MVDPGLPRSAPVVKAFRPSLLLPAALATLAVNAWLARFDHPMGDDWSYAYQGMAHPLGSWLWGEYQHWNGRYFSNMLVGRGPLVLGLDGLWLHRVVPVALMLLNTVAAFALVRSLTRASFNTVEQWSGALLFSALYLHGMPDLPEGFHWYTGAITYQLGSVLLLLHLACLADFLQGHQRSRSPARFVLNVILALLVVGSSEVHMILLLVFHGALLLVLRRGGGRIGTAEVVMMCAVLTGAAIMFLAPGNAVRAANFPERHRLVHSAWMSLLQTGRFGIEWVFDPALLFLSVLYVPMARARIARLAVMRQLGDLHPFLVPLAMGAVIFLCVFPAYWSTGILGQHRTVNVAYALFLPLWFVNLGLWSARLDRQGALALPWARKAIVLIAAAHLALGRNSANAWSDLLSGRAERFDAQLWQRYAILNAASDTQVDPVPVPLIHDPPHSLYLLELREDGADWVNVAYARYFGLHGRKVVPDPASTRSELR